MTCIDTDTGRARGGGGGVAMKAAEVCRLVLPGVRTCFEFSRENRLLCLSQAPGSMRFCVLSLLRTTDSRQTAVNGRRLSFSSRHAFSIIFLRCLRLAAILQVWGPTYSRQPIAWPLTKPPCGVQ